MQMFSLVLDNASLLWVVKPPAHCPPSNTFMEAFWHGHREETEMVHGQDVWREARKREGHCDCSRSSTHLAQPAVPVHALAWLWTCGSWCAGLSVWVRMSGCGHAGTHVQLGTCGSWHSHFLWYLLTSACKDTQMEIDCLARLRLGTSGDVWVSACTYARLGVDVWILPGTCVGLGVRVWTCGSRCGGTHIRLGCAACKDTQMEIDCLARLGMCVSVCMYTCLAIFMVYKWINCILNKIVAVVLDVAF
ncbi:hypothetical protein DFH08DRAFT_805495 [Mycena albidolilacea]|uniref:Uncharacterized protein n=1 Tax=Mycena albidolilacea TaxID=1033008 RepID=A0AAD7A9N2_9AGAR|nr:hypothetical protein DFH08DRAFT_805495 [Mycena albidolilacea]